MIAAFFAADKPKAREKKRAEVESWSGDPRSAWDKLAAMAVDVKRGEHPLTPFHWEIEFPEVFARENSGFDAIVGNPPFAGKNTIAAQLGTAMQTGSRRCIGAHGNSRPGRPLLPPRFRAAAAAAARSV